MRWIKNALRVPGGSDPCPIMREGNHGLFREANSGEFRALVASLLLMQAASRGFFCLFERNYRKFPLSLFRPASFSDAPMTRPRLHSRFSALIACAAMCAPGFLAKAEQPPAMSPPPAEVKTAPPPRAKPQVIYHLPRSSSYAATLHSQAKTQSHPLPIDSTMPPSLQMSRAAANEAAARAQQEQQLQQQQQAPRITSSPQQRIKRPKLQSRPAQMRKQGPGKPRGSGVPHGKKSGKK